MNDQAIEHEIQSKGADVAPRITPADVEANIASEHYFTAAEGVLGTDEKLVYGDFPDALSLLTICVLVLRNGYTVLGKSGVASPENFDTDIGKKIARDNAVREIWPLMGYALKERLYEAEAIVAGLPDTPDGMAAYSGTKQLFARPMNRGDYNDYRGCTLPADEDEADLGYLVEYINSGPANDPRHTGYISWSPASVFERTYQLI